MESLKKEIETSDLLSEVGRGGWEEWVKVVKRCKLSVIRQINPENVMHNIMTIVNNIVYLNLIVANRVDCKSSPHEENNS